MALRDLQTTSKDPMHQAGTQQDTHIFNPQSVDDLLMLQQRMSSQTCLQGVCLYLQQPTVSVADWLAKQNQSTQVSVGASTPKGFATGYYWIESWPLQSSDQQSPTPLIYHITAFSRGLYSGSLTMLQAIWLKPTGLTAHDFNTWQSLIQLNP